MTHDRLRQRAVVYRFFDTDGQLLYIGSSVNLAGRLTFHECKTPWFHEVATVTLAHFASYDAAFVAEKAAISAEQPPRNVYNKGPHGGVREAVLHALAELGEPTTARELAQHVSYPPGSVSAIVSELRYTGAVVVVGERRLSPRGRPCAVIALPKTEAAA